MFRALRELYKYRELTAHLVLLTLKTRYRGSFLGFFWTLLNPLLLMLVLWGVFSRVARVQEEFYALFLLSGLIVWMFFSQSVDAGQNSIVKQYSLIQKIYVPKIVFPVAVVTSNFVNFVFSLIAYILIAIIASYPIMPSMILLPVAFIMLYLLTVGSALMMSTLNVFFRDFTHLTATMLRALFYLTPVIYPVSLFGEKAAFILKFNPAYYPVTVIRDLLYYGTLSTLSTWLIGFAVALTIFVLGSVIFVKNEDNFIFYA